MPTETLRRGKRRWRAVVKQDGRIVASKWFGPGPKGRSAAVLWEAEWRKKAAEEQAKILSPEPVPLAWIVAYLEDARRRYAGRTYWEKKTAMDKLLAFVGEGGTLSGITPGVALKFLHAQVDERSGHVANRDRKNLAAAWDWGGKFVEGFPAAANPFRAVDKFPENASPRYVPKEEDFWEVLELAQGQDRVMLLAYFYTAARKDELFRLTWPDVDFVNKRLRLYTKKTRGSHWRADWLPILPELLPALSWWKDARPYKAAEHVFTCLDDTPSKNHVPGGPFKSRQHFMPRMCARAKVKAFGLHAIRHLRATVLYEGGARLHEVQKWLRHESAATTERYLKSLGLDVDQLAEAAMRGGGGKVIPFAAVRNSQAPGGISSEGLVYPPVYPPADKMATRL